MGIHHPRSVKFTGASARECLVGVRPLNRGLIVRVSEDQPRTLRGGGPIVGGFDLLCEGSGDYHEQLAAFTGRRFASAKALLDQLRVIPEAIKASHVLNRGELVVLERLIETLPGD